MREMKLSDWMANEETALFTRMDRKRRKAIGWLGAGMIIVGLAMLVLMVILGAGCAYLRSSTKTDKQGVVTTSVRAFTVFDSQSALAKFQNRGTLTASNEWAPGTTIGTLQQQSATTTNFNDLVGTVVKAAVQGAVTGAK